MRYENKLKISKLEKGDPLYRPLHQPSGRFVQRMKKKAMAKSNWYKDQSSNKEDEEQLTELKGGPKGRTTKRKAIEYKKAGNEEVQTSTVMSVPNTKGAILINKLKEGEKIWLKISGFRVKYVEAGGTQLIRLFNQDLGKGTHCGRKTCPPCDTSEEGKRQN